MKFRSAAPIGVILGLLLASGAPSAEVSASPSSSSSAAVSPVAIGTIEGEIIVPPRPARRVAERYPTAGRGASQEQPPVPAVVHLEGPASGGAARASVESRTLVQRDTAFTPGLLVVSLGGEVAFPNEDPFFHNVFSYSRPKRFDLGRYSKGESKSVTFDQPGYLKVFCEIHQWMRAGILVVENPHHAAVGEDGRFTLPSVPAGRHTLVVTDFDRGTKEVTVDVPAGETVRVRVDFGR